jgi:hypothetical protein
MCEEVAEILTEVMEIIMKPIRDIAQVYNDLEKLVKEGF